MAMLFHVRYPGGEEATATGYPPQVAPLVVVREVPLGPEACLFDELEIGQEGDAWIVRRIAGGPRKPAFRVQIEEAKRDEWMDAREAEGWWVGLHGDTIAIVRVEPPNTTLEEDRLVLEALGVTPT